MTFWQNVSYIQVSLKNWKQRLGWGDRVILFLRGFCFLLSQEGSCGGEGNATCNLHSTQILGCCNIHITVVAMIYSVDILSLAPSLLQKDFTCHINCTVTVLHFYRQWLCKYQTKSNTGSLWSHQSKYSVSRRKIQYVFSTGTSCW